MEGRRGRPPVKEGERARSVGVTLPESMIGAMDELIGDYGSRSKFIRRAVERYITFKKRSR